MITYICGSSGIQSGDIPERFWKDLERIMDSGDGDEEKAYAFWEAWNETDVDDKSAKKVIESWNSIKD